MPKIKRSKNPLKSTNGHASSSTTPVAQDLPVASTYPSQADGKKLSSILMERIIVDFDAYNSAYGDAQGLLAGYCGSLAIDCNLFLISFERWSGQSGMLEKYMEDCF
uniref:Uncharacterized protein n=1 Tax=Solanum lycopersicum TaxID=4081 RepID=A0A3Q7J9T7_SOLLC